jgi:hypothetical protein
MADLEEIMAGGGRTPEPEPQTTHEQPQPAAEPTPVEPQQQEPQNPDANPNPDDDADPVTGLRKALDAERGKGRKYKETVEHFENRIAAMQQQFDTLLTVLKAQQRPQQPQQEQPKPADFWENPDAFLDERLTQTVNPLQAEVQTTREFYSRRLAEKDHGPEKVQEAYSALDAAIARGELPGDAVKASLLKSMDPYGDIMNWYQSRPEAQRERMRAELMAELGIQPGQQPAAAPQAEPQPATAPQAMPTSFAGQRNAGPRTTPQWTGPQPLSAIMKR